MGPERGPILTVIVTCVASLAGQESRHFKNEQEKDDTEAARLHGSFNFLTKCSYRWYVLRLPAGGGAALAAGGRTAERRRIVRHCHR